MSVFIIIAEFIKRAKLLISIQITHVCTDYFNLPEIILKKLRLF